MQMPIYAEINEELDKEFRLVILKKFGNRRNRLRIALEEAINLWIEKNKEGG